MGVQEAWFQFFFLNLTTLFDIKFKNTYNLNFLDFKVPSERFFHKDLKTGLTFLKYVIESEVVNKSVGHSV